MNHQQLHNNHFHHYANTPAHVYMREIYAGMYISYNTKDKAYRIMPDHAREFPGIGIHLPHTTLPQITAMVHAMGGDWITEALERNGGGHHDGCEECSNGHKEEEEDGTTAGRAAARAYLTAENYGGEWHG